MGTATLGVRPTPTIHRKGETNLKLVKKTGLGGDHNEPSASPVVEKAPEIFKVIGFTPTGRIRVLGDDGTEGTISMRDWISRKTYSGPITEAVAEATIDIGHSPIPFSRIA